MHQRLFPYFVIARPDHWIKHIFILPGILIALILDPSSEFNILNIAMGTLSACLIASANYVINEYLDAESDKFHPTKKGRMAVVHSLPARYVYLEYVLLISLGLALASYINVYFLGTASLFAIMAVLYNVRPFRLKDRFLCDVLSESINNPLRLLFGWFMVTSITVPPSSLLLSYWSGGAFLMAAKRFSEYRHLVSEVPLDALVEYRRSFGSYSEASLVGSMFCYALLCGFLLSAFVLKYRSEYFLTFPFLVTLFTYYVVLSFERDSAVQAPEKLHKNVFLMVTMFLLFVSFVFLTYVDIPFLNTVLMSHAIEVEAIRHQFMGAFK